MKKLFVRHSFAPFVKKTLSLFLSLVMLVSVVVGTSITSFASAWASNSTNIEFNTEYTLYCTNKNKAPREYLDTCDSYHIGLHVNIPLNGSITFNMTSKYVYNCPLIIKIYNASDLDNEINTYYPSTEYSSAYDIYKSSIKTALNKGEYYILCIVNDTCDRIRDGKSDGSFTAKINYKPNISTPSTLKVSTRSTTSLKLAWNKASGVSGYQLQRKSGESWKTVANTSATSYTVKSLKAGTTYNFRVRAYKTIDGTKYYSGWKTLTTPTKPSTPSIKSPATNKKHQIIAKWKKVSACSGYQVQYSKKKNFSSVIATKTVSGQSKTSYTGKNFTKGKTYYVRVRSYKTVNGTKYYSAWSSVKSIKCK